MSSAKRRINSTGRKRIRQNSIQIEILDSPVDKPLLARMQLDLDSYRFPQDSRVVIEAYYRSSSMRFDCGTVSNLKIPEPLCLREIDRSGTVLFRVKIVDQESDIGRLLGSAERIRPEEIESTDSKPILPIVTLDLNHDIWKVSLEERDRPKLVLNKGLRRFWGTLC